MSTSFNKNKMNKETQEPLRLSPGVVFSACTNKENRSREQNTLDNVEKRDGMPNFKYMQNIYEMLHEHPEVSLREFKTADFVTGELEKLGFAVRTRVGGTGVVGVLEFGRPGEILALRCDMDALPLQENTDVPYASKNAGVMHACGHDSHMATILGTCAFAAQNKERLSGTLMAIFQPAEEIVVGAQAMLDQGIFAEKKPGRLVGIHNWPSLPAGAIGLQNGPLTAFADGFKVTFLGEGGHGALPYKTKDPIAMATAAVQNALTLAHRRMNSNHPQTLSFGMIQGGTSFNIIPSKVVVEGTVRTTRLEDQETMIGLLHKAFAAGANLHSGEYVLEYRKGVPAVINNEIVVKELEHVFQTKIPEIPVVTQGLASLIGEDLAYFLEKVPGVLLLIGSGQENGISELHHPSFLVPTQTLEIGYKALTSIVEEYLR